MAENLFGIYIYMYVCVRLSRWNRMDNWYVNDARGSCGLFEFHSSNLGGSLVMFEIYEKYETINICVYIV